MLHNPKYGRATIKIGDFEDRCSYLRDVPKLIWRALDKSVRTYDTTCVSIDAEGYEYIIVFDQFNTHIIMENAEADQYSLKTINVSYRELAREFIDDIRRDLDEWARWTDYGDMSAEEKEERARDLVAMCEVLEGRLDYVEGKPNAKAARKEVPQ